MQIYITEDNSLLLRHLHPVELECLRQIPTHADPTEVPEAEDRLYPELLSPGEYDESGTAEEDWTEFVVPELKEQFSDAIRTVINDLANIGPDEADGIDDEDNDEDAAADDASEDDGEVVEEVEAEIEQTPPSATPRNRKGSQAEDSAEDHFLRIFSQKNVYFQLKIPAENLEHWLSAMNQARLVMTEKDLWVEQNGRLHGPVLSQIHYEIYCSLQEIIVQILSSEY